MKEECAYVVWVDSQSTKGWEHFDKKVDREPCKIVSVGLLVDDCKKSVTITTSRSKSHKACDFLTIPRSAIRKFKRFKIGR